MSEKIFTGTIAAIIVVILCGCIALLFTGCAGNPRVDPAILEYQRKVDTLESRIRGYEQTTEYAVRELEAVTGRAGKIEGTIDELISLFDDYQRTVERILRNYRATEGEVGNKIEGGACTGDCPRS